MSGSIAIAADHAGFRLKETLKGFLDQQDIPYHDFGCPDESSCDYPDYAKKVALAVQKGEHTQGILCCGSGIGMAMTANRYDNVRAAVCYDLHSAAMSRRHNDANVLCLGGRVTAPEYVWEIVQLFLSTEFDGGRHTRRVEKINMGTEREEVQC